MNSGEKALVSIILGAFVLLGVLVSFGMVTDLEETRIIAKSDDPMATACALDAGYTNTSPACVIYINRKE